MSALRVAVLAALFTLSPGPASAQPAAPVQIINLASYSFSPAPILLPAGRPVTLQFVNRSNGAHDFTAARFFAASRILAGRVNKGEVELAARQAASVTLIPAAGRYNVYCSHPFHKLLGMHSTIVVQ